MKHDVIIKTMKTTLGELKKMINENSQKPQIVRVIDELVATIAADYDLQSRNQGRLMTDVRNDVIDRLSTIAAQSVRNYFVNKGLSNND